MENTHASARKASPEATAFAAQLRAERAAAGFSQDELAKRTGISKSTILRIEAGTRVMDTSQLGAICRALGITIGTFAGRAEERLQAELGASQQRRRNA